MTLGTSLFSITILVFIFLGIKYISKKKKWRLAGRVAGVLLLIIIVIGLSVFGWYRYQDRLRPISSLGSISLGMSPIEVSLALGKPSQETQPDNFGGSRTYTYSDYSGEKFIMFSNSENTTVDSVSIICSDNYNDKVFGLGKYSSEKEVLKKLGEPTKQSIRSDGLAKTISYEKWNVSFEIQKGEVGNVCISSSGKVSYKNEYEATGPSDQILDLKNSPLTTTDRTPIITGTYSGDAGIKVEITKENKVVLTGFSDHGGTVELSSDDNNPGRFSYQVSPELEPGTYSVKVFVFHNIYNNGYQGNTDPVLTNSGTITVQ
jgi:hypothetical protein